MSITIRHMNRAPVPAMPRPLNKVGTRDPAPRALGTRVRRSRISYLVFVTVLAVYILEFSTFLVTSTTLDFLLKGACLVVLAVMPDAPRLSRRAKLLMWLYAVFFAIALVPNLGSATGAIQYGKILGAFATLPLILRMFGEDADLSPLLKFQIPIAIVLSVQSLMLFWMIWIGSPPDGDLIHLGRNDVMEQTFGIWGYANATVIAGTDVMLRAQSWFLEPTFFGMFLEFSVFITYGFYRLTGRVRYLLAFVICTAGLIITTSLAAFLSVMTAIMFAAVWLFVGRFRLATTHVARTALTAVAAITCVVASQSILTRLNDAYDPFATDRIAKVVARDPTTQTLVRETDIVAFTMESITASPLGTGLERTLGNRDDMASANAFLYWLQASGWPGVMALLAVYYVLFVEIAVPALASRGMIRYVAMAFVAQTVHGLSGGNWMTPMYLVTVACLILLSDRHDGSGLANKARPNRLTQALLRAGGHRPVLIAP